MSIYKRNKIYWVQINIPGESTPLRRSSKSTKRRDAERLERDLKNKLEENQSRGLRGLPPRRVFDDALEKYLASGLAPPSMTSHIKQLAIVMQGVAMEESAIIEAASRAKTLWLDAGLKPATVNRRLSVLQRVLNIAYREWRWTTAPLADYVAPLRVSEKGTERHFYLSKEQVHGYFSRVENPVAQKAFFALVLSGLRVGELLKLDKGNWTGAAIRLDAKQKGKRPRSIPIPEYAHELFEELPFAISYRGLSYWMEKVRGEDDVRIHDLRHTFASWLVDDPTIPMALVRDLLGHSSISVTNRYSHIRNERSSAIEGALPILNIKQTQKQTQS